MSKSIVRIRGNIDKILKINEKGSAIVLFKNENEIAFNLKSSIIMIEISKRQWKGIKDNPNLLELYLDISGKFEIRTMKENKPYLYVKSVTCKKLKTTAQEDTIKHLDKITENYEREIKAQEKEQDNRWFEKIEEKEFKEIDINKVKLVEEIHLNSRVSIFNIRNMNKSKELTPIAVRENEIGEYELIAGLRTFIVGKLFSRNVKAYITNLSRAEFIEKYPLSM